MPPKSRTGRTNAARHADGLCTLCPGEVTDRNKQGRPYFMGFTQRVERPLNRRAVPIATFGEAPAGTAPPIATWHPIGSSRGHRFIYPAR